VKKNCVICDAEFDAPANHKTCGKECSKKRKYMLAQCPHRKARKNKQQHTRRQDPEVKAKERIYAIKNYSKTKKMKAKYAREYNKIPENRRKINERRRKNRKGEHQRLMQDPKYRLKSRFYSTIRRCLKKYTIKESKTKTLKNLYTIYELKIHLESLFTDGMSWDNIGEWHIDHIRPVSSFDFDSTDHPDFKKCWALDNLQPLWAKDNLSKGAKWDGVVNA